MAVQADIYDVYVNGIAITVKGDTVKYSRDMNTSEPMMVHGSGRIGAISTTKLESRLQTISFDVPLYYQDVDNLQELRDALAKTSVGYATLRLVPQIANRSAITYTDVSLTETGEIDPSDGNCIPVTFKGVQVLKD